MGEYEIPLTLIQLLDIKYQIETYDPPPDQLVQFVIFNFLKEPSELSATEQAELDAMAQLSDDELGAIALIKSDGEKTRRAVLLYMNSKSGGLSKEEFAELTDLGYYLLGIHTRKARAARLLHERGHTLVWVEDNVNIFKDSDFLP